MSSLKDILYTASASAAGEIILGLSSMDSDFFVRANLWLNLYERLRGLWGVAGGRGKKEGEPTLDERVAALETKVDTVLTLQGKILEEIMALRVAHQ